MSSDIQYYIPSKVIILSWRSFQMTSNIIIHQKWWHSVMFTIWKAIAEWHFKWHLVLFSPKMAFLGRIYFQMKSNMIYRIKWPLWARCHFKRHPVLLSVYSAHSELDFVSSDIHYLLPCKVAILSRMSFLMTSNIIHHLKLQFWTGCFFKWHQYIYRLKWRFWDWCHFKWHPVLLIVLNRHSELQFN